MARKPDTERARRSERIRGVYIEPLSWRMLYREDGPACYLCGFDTDPEDFQTVAGSDGREATVVGLEYPTLDHVVPLSEGGGHERGNVRLAHFYCNCIKSANPLEEVQPQWVISERLSTSPSVPAA